MAVVAHVAVIERTTSAQSSGELDPVQCTLLIPLIARALAQGEGNQREPEDASALHVLKELGWAPEVWMPDVWTMGFILWRTRRFRDWGKLFFDRHPSSLGMNLGAGLSDYFQWLRNGSNHWVDADLPAVVALRKSCLHVHDGAACLSVDLLRSGWWRRLAACASSRAEPVWILCEGVLLYMPPGDVCRMLRLLGECAPVGSELVLDCIPRWMVGWSIHTPWMLGQSARFQWGIDSLSELADIHPRLHVRQAESCMGLSDALSSSAQRAWNPWAPYGLVRLSID